MIKLMELIKYVINKKYASLFLGNLINGNNKIYFYDGNDPKLININNLEDIEKFEKFNLNDYWGYAKIDYEFGYKIYNIDSEDFGNNYFIFDKKNNWKVFTSRDLIFDEKNQDEDSEIINCNLMIQKNDYLEKIREIKNEIKEGNTYQINYTTKYVFEYQGKLENIIYNLLKKQTTEYSAIINNDSEIIVSISPELFFKIENGIIKSSPMKGTIKRGYSIDSDKFLKNSLFKSKKNRAENIMIVDLIRNDLGKICKKGTVKVDKLFKIEKYETLYQMISMVSGKLEENIKLKDVIASLFPCGSITGAPKKSSMKIIKKLENDIRGIYTGTLGLITNVKLVFNIPIRTLVIDKSLQKGIYGVGSGVTFRSNPLNEYNEVKLKYKFLERQKEFYLIETILLENGNYFLLDEHMKRLETTANYFIFRFPEKEILGELKKITLSYSTGKWKVRIHLYKFGNFNIEVEEITDINRDYHITIFPQKIDTKKWWFNFKTSKREVYNTGLKFAKDNGFDEIIFINKKGEVTEGSFTNIFYKKNGQWYTPAIISGLLDGIFRQKLIKEGAVEKVTTMNELIGAEEIILVNSVRGKIRAKLVL